MRGTHRPLANVENCFTSRVYRVTLRAFNFHLNGQRGKYTTRRRPAQAPILKRAKTAFLALRALTPCPRRLKHAPRFTMPCKAVCKNLASFLQSAPHPSAIVRRVPCPISSPSPSRRHADRPSPSTGKPCRHYRQASRTVTVDV